MNKKIHSTMNRSEPLITPLELSQEFPATIAQTHFVEQSRQQIIRILQGLDNRLLLILGPCSIHETKAALDYARKIKELYLEISDVFFPVMRFYFEKPRTRLGWKGLMHDPYLDGSFDVNAGLRLTRKLLIALMELQVPAAAEILDPISGCYFGDLLSWGCIGARTASSQLHRQAASGLPMPVGFKNTTEGNVDVAIHGILCASEPHGYIGIDETGRANIIRTQGNSHCHLTLRGGEKGPNYDSSSIAEALSKLEKSGLFPRLLVDCSHDNSRRDYKKQTEVFDCVLDQILSGNRNIKGMILESHLNPGRQDISNDPNLLKYAISLTDSCIDWETTEEMILSARKKLLATTDKNEECLIHSKTSV